MSYIQQYFKNQENADKAEAWDTLQLRMNQRKQEEEKMQKLQHVLEIKHLAELEREKRKINTNAGVDTINNNSNNTPNSGKESFQDMLKKYNSYKANT